MRARQSTSGKIKATGLLSTLIIAMLLLPGLPWSAFCKHKLNKILIKAAMTLSQWRGYQPRLLSIVGESDSPGARVHALYSPSGWATVCDGDGKFKLPDVLWYSGASYEIVFSNDEIKGKVVQVRAPSSYPASGFIDIGKLSLKSLKETSYQDLIGDTSYSYEKFDLPNRDYYRSIYDEITVGLKTDEAKVEAVNQYVTERLNYKETQWELGSPRRIIEGGSRYCGHLGNTMATILAVAYPVRIIHLTDAQLPANTHVVVEVFYDNAWHLYDPTFGIRFINNHNRVVSYKELRLNPGMVSLDSFAEYKRKYPKIAINPLPDIYTSGHHHYYYMAFESKQYAHAWWAYKAGLNYVSSGDPILLAGAGIRKGSNVTYHIRKPGNQEDELVFNSIGGATSNNVLNEEESPAIDLPAGQYEVFVDLYDGNISKENSDNPVLIKNWRLKVKLEIR
jgi:hypothetical protein